MIRLALVEDHKMFRAGIRALLSKEKDIDVVLECDNGKEFLECLDHEIDIVMMDLDMPKLNGIQTMEVLYQRNPDLKVIFVSKNKEAVLISSLMELGARGYLHKEADEDELINAIHSVMSSGYYFNDMVSHAMLKKLATKEEINPTFNQGMSLSAREQQVLELICKEMTTDEIGERLFISPKTVENHRTRIMEKSGARNAAGLVVYAIKNKLFDVG